MEHKVQLAQVRKALMEPKGFRELKELKVFKAQQVHKER
jgi:hypothetical protein